MAGKANDEALLEERLSELGLAITQGDELAFRATITPLTLAASAFAHASSSSSDSGGSESESVVDQLPRMSIRPSSATSVTEAAAAADARHEYAIVGMLGEGGMGSVHLARQRSLAREVALKTLKPGATPAISEALLREARLTGALEHPGVIPVHALGIDDNGHPILVMKRVDGVELSVLLHDDAHAAWRARGRSADRLVASIEILMHVCLTLEFAHSRGVIHRDIKPENVMVGAFGEVYLLDWGIALTLAPPSTGKEKKEATTRPIVGTPAYMAPEMAIGNAIDVRTDIYLLGATLHEILTGKPRHNGSTLLQVIRAAMKSEPFDYGPSVPEQLARLCNRATASDPAARFSSVAEVREALADFLRNRSARALCDTAVQRIAALEAMLAATTMQGEGPPKDIADAYRLVTEARFGLTQSLREDSRDPVTRRAMQRCLLAALELELRQGHADAADALLREMEPNGAANDDVAQRIAETRERGAQARERLEALERDLDPTEHSAKRTAAVVAAAIALVGVVGVTVARFDSSTPIAGVAGATAATTIIVIGLLGLRRRLLTNAFNRRLGGLLLLLSGSVLANRLLGMAMGMRRADTVSIDLLIVTTIVLSMSISVLPRIAWCVPILLTALAATRIWPHAGPLIFGAATVIGLLVGAAILASTRKPSPKSSSSSGSL